MRLRTILGFIFLIILILCGCQSTPEADVVVGKGNGELENIIAGPTASQQNIMPQESDNENKNSVGEVITYTDEWKEAYKLPYLVCDIDADVILPTANEFPVFKVQQRSFDTETLRKVIDYFTKEATGVRDTSNTKEELEDLLVQAKKGQYVWDDNGGRWEPYEGQEQEIKDLEQRIINAEPEVFVPVTDAAVSIPMDKTYSLTNGARIYISANSKSIGISPIKFGLVQLESWVIRGDAFPGEPAGTTIDNIKISEEEAKNTVKGLLSELGIDNLGIAETEKARIIKDFSFDIVSEGWQITLTRNDGNSIPVYINSTETSGLLDYQSEDYIYRWPPESITIYVDENGPRSFYWQYPIEVVEKENSNVPIKPFDEIKETIRKYIKFAFSKKIEGREILEQQITLNKIVLTEVLMPIKDETQYHMLVPAWIVFYEQEDALGVNTSVLAINAIDGSSIDLTFYPPKE